MPCLPPGDLPKPGIKPRSPALQADSLPSEPPVPASKQCLFTKNADWCSLHPSLFKVSCSSRTSPKLCPSVSSNQRTPTMSDACHKPLGTWAAISVSGSQRNGVLFRYPCNLQKFTETLKCRAEVTLVFHPIGPSNIPFKSVCGETAGTLGSSSSLQEDTGGARFKSSCFLVASASP